MQLIHTIGTRIMHGVKRKSEKFLSLMEEHGVDAIVDVRRTNEGGLYKFASGEHIRNLVEKHGVAYVWEPRLAPSEELRAEWKRNKNWPDFIEKYNKEMGDRDMLSVGKEIASEFKRPCLLCAEASSEFCHRRLLAEHIAQGIGDRIVHIG